MLVEIKCDKFNQAFQTIHFQPGLNVILGDSSGSNALGKTTFLWIIDFVFGGTGYCSPDKGILTYVGQYKIYFTFRFDGTEHYFFRSTDDPQNIVRCDASGQAIMKMKLRDYQSFLGDNFAPKVSMEDIRNHFFRIYTRGNTSEEAPYLANVREKEENAVDFLLKLFGRADIVTMIQELKEEGLFTKDTNKKEAKKAFDPAQIEKNERVIEQLQARMDELMKGTSAGLHLLGLPADTTDKLIILQRELRNLTSLRNQYQIKLDGLKKGTQDYFAEPIRSDFSELTEFFPDVNLKKLDEIERFHGQIRDILQDETNIEIDRIELELAHCDRDINSFQNKLNEAGIAGQITDSAFSQCIQISRQIDKLKEENEYLRRQKEALEAQAKEAQRIRKALADQQLAIGAIQTKINEKLTDLNTFVTDGKENPPELIIFPEKSLSFRTAGDTSEGTACKNLVLYDLAILSLTDLPAVIHDSNMLHSISSDHFVKLSEIYGASGKQVFIATNRGDVPEIKKSAVLELSGGNVLFGHSWSKHNPDKI